MKYEFLYLIYYVKTFCIIFSVDTISMELDSQLKLYATRRNSFPLIQALFNEKVTKAFCDVFPTMVWEKSWNIFKYIVLKNLFISYKLKGITSKVLPELYYIGLLVRLLKYKFYNWQSFQTYFVYQTFNINWYLKNVCDALNFVCLLGTVWKYKYKKYARFHLKQDDFYHLQSRGGGSALS